jgi:arylsulfatase A-like enzyme
MSFFSLLLGCALPAQALQVGAAAERIDVAKPPPNFVVIVADDFGVDLLGAYAEGPTPACTPNIDSLASEGMLFRNAWAFPVCSPTRATLLTGRYPLRHGIGNAIEMNDAGLPLSEVTLPEMLGVRYDSACIGKWHLSGTSGNLHPNQSGFSHFAGFLRGAVTDYSQWSKVVDGHASVSTNYTTTDITDEAIAALGSMQSPWLLYVAYNAPHAPLHVPPASVCQAPTCATTYCGNLPPSPTPRQLARAMVEAMDSEIGRLLASLATVDPNAYVFFLGDNGTAGNVAQPPFVASHAKGSLYEGGVNVPFLVRGPRVARAECAALVSVADVFATLASLAGRDVSADDSVSLVPCFHDPNASLRASVYAEAFTPNGGTLPHASHSRAVRDARYKLIRVSGAPDELYDLLNDPFETANLLLGALSSTEQAAYDALVAELVALGVD